MKDLKSLNISTISTIFKKKSLQKSELSTKYQRNLPESHSITGKPTETLTQNKEWVKSFNSAATKKNYIIYEKRVWTKKALKDNKLSHLYSRKDFFTTVFLSIKGLKTPTIRCVTKKRTKLWLNFSISR